MAEETETKPEEKPPEEKPEVKPLPALSTLTPEHLEKLKREIRDEMTELHSSDKAEREELKRQLDELNEYKKKQEEAQSERDKVEGSQHTLVLPPNDLPPQQPNPNPETKGEPREEGKPRKRWKDIW